MPRTPIALLLLAAACSGESTRVITVGDNVGANPTFRTSYIGLLAANDDALFPEFAKKSLPDLYGEGFELVRLDRGGDSFHNIATAERPYCTCAGDECTSAGEPCIDTGEHEDTILIIELGGNDLLQGFLTMVNDEALRADPRPLLDRLRADVRVVLGMAGDTSRFPTAPAKVFVTNVYDPSDGVGDVAAIAARLLPPSFGIDPTVVTPELGLRVLGDFNTIVAEETKAIGGVLVDAHAHFLGHGYHHDEAMSPHHDAADPTAWIRGAFDPTLRGAHELRRLLWTALSGESITAIPKDLPPPSLLDVPAVPDEGWAKALVAAEITQSLHSDDLDVDWPNVMNDPEKVVGPPTGKDDGIVAIGSRGAFVIVDLGADTVATDGDGDDVVVLEFGTVSGGVPEPYRVSVSDAPGGPFSPVADARGERAFDIGAVGVSRARYVKVESLAAAVDILGGLGSATAPGPEIDAIGAVYPGKP